MYFEIEKGELLFTHGGTMKRLLGHLFGAVVLLTPSVSFASPRCNPPRHQHYSGNGYNSGYHNGSYNGYNSGHNNNGYHGGNGYGQTYGTNYGWGQGNRGSTEQLISNGARTGQLTGSELKAINREDRELREKAARYRSDGYLSDGERRDLSKEYREFRSEVVEEVNDGEHRRWNKW